MIHLTQKVRKLVDDFSNLKDIVGKDIKAEFGGEAQAYTLATTEDTEQDEKEDDKPNVFDIDVNNVGAGQAAMAGILSGGIKIGAGFFSTRSNDKRCICRRWYTSG